MSIIDSRRNWPIDNQEARLKKGRLIRVEISPGRIVKMYEADAAARGYVVPQVEKALPPAQNKMRLPEEDKNAEAGKSQEPADDFTTIDGVGPATARALVVNGITTFAQLRAAGKLSFLTASANAAIEEWRNNG